MKMQNVRLLSSIVLIVMVSRATVANTATSPIIVAKATKTLLGTYIIYTVGSSADGNFRATVYLQGCCGMPTCASMAWTDDTAPVQSPNVCSPSGSQASFVIAIHAKAGTVIYLNDNGNGSGGSSGTVYATLERF